MRSNVLLTGGTGFVGGYVAAALSRAGHAVTVLTRREGHHGYIPSIAVDVDVTFKVMSAVQDDLPALIADSRPDIVIHLAAESRSSEDSAGTARIVDANLRFGALLLHAMVENDIPALINCGTFWQTAQDGAYDPLNLYAASKQAFEVLLAHYRKMGLRAITLRLFDTCGPLDQRGRIVDLLVDSILAGEELAMSPGEQFVDLLDVRDVADAFVEASERVRSLHAGDHEIYGVNSKAPVMLRDLAQRIGAAMERQPRVVWGGRPYRPRELMMPCQTLGWLPGWQPTRVFANTVRDIAAAKRVSRREAAPS